MKTRSAIPAVAALLCGTPLLAANPQAAAGSSPAQDISALVNLVGDVIDGKNPSAAELKPLENVRRQAADALGIDPNLEFDLDAIAAGIKMIRMVPYTDNGWTEGGEAVSSEEFTFDPQRIMQVAKLVMQASDIVQKVSARKEKHDAELAKKGIAEVPASNAACRFKIEAGKNTCLFDQWGELFVDRRFVTKDEMKTVHQLEDDYRKIYAGSSYAKNPKAQKLLPPRSRAPKSPGSVPVFRGFEDARYQAYDQMIIKLVADFNAHKTDWIGGSPEQAAKVADLTPAQVKSHMIEESGGNDKGSKAAWAVDPLQVNVPGDWDEAKTEIGLTKPTKRNEGNLETNVRAAIKFLSRKGFGVSGRPARVRPAGFFDGWKEALRRYNGRRDRTESGHYYSDAYATKILDRAEKPDVFMPIEIKLAK